MDETEYWIAVDPQGHPQIDTLAYVKSDCRLTAEQKRTGWRVTLVRLVEVDDE
jgi:hypothetical protein